MSRATHQQRRARWLNAVRPGWLGMTRAQGRSSVQVDRRRWGDRPYDELTPDVIVYSAATFVVCTDGTVVTRPGRWQAWTLLATVALADLYDLDDSPVGGKVVEAGVDVADRDVSPPALLVESIIAAPHGPTSAGVTLAAAQITLQSTAGTIPAATQTPHPRTPGAA